MGKLSRTKGMTAEREVCALLSKHSGLDIKRKLGQERDAGHDIDFGRWRIECKRRARVAKLYLWLAECGAKPGPGLPVVALRGDQEEWLVILKLEDWLTYKVMP